jgi:hypothetical protein
MQPLALVLEVCALTELDPVLVDHPEVPQATPQAVPQELVSCHPKKAVSVKEERQERQER